MIFNKLTLKFFSVLVTASLSGYFFYGVGADRQITKYEKIIARANAEAMDRYKMREAELMVLSEQRVAKELAMERQRRSAEREVVNYVTKEKASDISTCAITHNGLRYISNYINTSFHPKD